MYSWGCTCITIVAENSWWYDLTRLLWLTCSAWCMLPTHGLVGPRPLWEQWPLRNATLQMTHSNNGMQTLGAIVFQQLWVRHLFSTTGYVLYYIRVLENWLLNASTNEHVLLFESRSHPITQHPQAIWNTAPKQWAVTVIILVREFEMSFCGTSYIVAAPWSFVVRSLENINWLLGYI